MKLPDMPIILLPCGTSKVLKPYIAFILLLLPLGSRGQTPDLEEISAKVNKTLPKVYDPVTKLKTTTVENNQLVYHFLVDADQAQFNSAFPKVKRQVLKTICSESQEKLILAKYQRNIIYSYENLKGQSLGRFLIAHEHCGAKASK